MYEILGSTPSIKKGRERGKGEGQTSELSLKGNACGEGEGDNRQYREVVYGYHVLADQSRITHVWRRLVNGREKDNTCALHFLEDKGNNFALICAYTSGWK